MPVYEYVCNECGERFERLVMAMSGPEGIKCPYCGSLEVQRAVSAFASSGSCYPTRRFG